MTLAGSGFAGHADGIGSAASFNYPTGVSVDSNGLVFVAESGNSMIRKISSDGKELLGFLSLVVAVLAFVCMLVWALRYRLTELFVTVCNSFV